MKPFADWLYLPEHQPPLMTLEDFARPHVLTLAIAEGQLDTVRILLGRLDEEEKDMICANLLMFLPCVRPHKR